MKPMPSANSAASSLPLITLEHLGSEMGRRIQAFDWSTTPLGPISFWPQSLRTVVNILLTSRYSMWMAWGNELTMLYNDAYRPTLPGLSVLAPVKFGRKSGPILARAFKAC